MLWHGFPTRAPSRDRQGAQTPLRPSGWPKSSDLGSRLLDRFRWQRIPTGGFARWQSPPCAVCHRSASGATSCYTSALRTAIGSVRNSLASVSKYFTPLISSRNPRRTASPDSSIRTADSATQSHPWSPHNSQRPHQSGCNLRNVMAPRSWTRVSSASSLSPINLPRQPGLAPLARLRAEADEACTAHGIAGSKASMNATKSSISVSPS